MTEPDLGFAMPQGLVARGFAVRPRGPEDTDFLRELYTSFRWAELEATGWPEAARRAFLADQFRLQDHHYATHYGRTAALLIIMQDGAPAGRLYIDRGGVREIRLVDIILLPTLTGQGTGSVPCSTKPPAPAASSACMSRATTRHAGCTGGWASSIAGWKALTTT